MARSGRGGSGRRRGASGGVLGLVLGGVLVFEAYRGGADRMPEVYAGYLIGCALLPARPLLGFGLATALDAHVPLVVIGSGPVLVRRVGPKRVTLLRTYPLRFSMRYQARRAHYLRDMRLMLGVGLFGPLLLALVLSVVSSGYAAAVMFTLVGYDTVRFALAKDRVSKRRTFHRVFFRTTPERDPQLFDPRWLDHDEAARALVFGDLATTQKLLPVLRNGFPEVGTAVLEEALHEIGGDLAAALRTLADYPPASAHRARLEEARLWLLAAERDPALGAEAAGRADAYLRSGAPVPDRSMYASVLALLRVETGHAADARASAHAQLGRAYDPVSIADALCTRARVEAALGQRERASRTLRRAQEAAPWYARIAAVRGRIAAEPQAGADVARFAQDPGPGTGPGPLEDPWAAPRG